MIWQRLDNLSRVAICMRSRDFVERLALKENR